MKCHGFNNIQYSVHIGQEGTSEAHEILVTQELTAKHSWFSLRGLHEKQN